MMQEATQLTLLLLFLLRMLECQDGTARTHSSPSSNVHMSPPPTGFKRSFFVFGGEDGQ